MVYGDKRPHLVALVVPDDDFVAAWAKENGKPRELSALADDEAFRSAIGKALERVNQKLSSLEKVRRFVVAPEAFTVDNEMMTPTLKIRRHVIKATYGDALERLYERG